MSARVGRGVGRAGVLLAAISALGGLAPAYAGTDGPQAVAFQPADAMATGPLTSQPIGHYEFCKLNPGECNVHPANRAPLKMTDAMWARVNKINVGVNTSVKPANDIDIYGRDEVWAYPKGRGDCEDYVLEKRRELAQTGISLADLLITVVKKPDGEGHAVLTLRTDEGDFVLDNLSNSVRSWDATGYRFLKRQAEDNTGRWVSIRDGQATAVAAVKAVR